MRQLDHNGMFSSPGEGDLRWVNKVFADGRIKRRELQAYIFNASSGDFLWHPIEEVYENEAGDISTSLHDVSPV